MRCGKWKSAQLRSSLNNCRGFTLLEVIMALGIVAVGILAVSRAITGFAGTTLSLEQRMIASWVASNRLETHRILKTTPVVGTTHGSEEMAGHTWYFSETTTTTADPNLFRLDIVVFTDRDETEEAGNMYGYLLNYEAVNQPIITGSSHRDWSLKSSLVEDLGSNSQWIERNWVPAFATMMEAQSTAIIKVKFTEIANAKRALHCEGPAMKQSYCYWELVTGLPRFGAGNQKEVVALLQEMPAGCTDELHGAMYEA